MKDAIESLRWSAEETERSKSIEIDKLKQDLHHFRREKEEAMELQRQDLTLTFDSILSQKETTIANKEKEITNQIMILESRLEALLNENMKLRSSLSESRRLASQVQEEGLAKQESLRQLQWRVEDEVKIRAQLEDRISSSTQKHKIEIDTIKEVLAKAEFDHRIALDNVSSCQICL